MLMIQFCIVAFLQTSSLTSTFWSFSVVVESHWSSSCWGKLISSKYFSKLIHSSGGKLWADCWRFLHSSSLIARKKISWSNLHCCFPSVWDTLKMARNGAPEVSRQKMFVVRLSQKKSSKTILSFYPCGGESQMDPCIASVIVEGSPGIYGLDSSCWGFRRPCWSFRCLCYPLHDVFYPVVAFSSFHSKQFVFRISPCCWLKKAAGASVWRISFLDGKFDDPSSSLKICEEISKVSNLTVAPTGVFCLEVMLKVSRR